MDPPPLTDADRARYEWQMACPGVGDVGQRRLRAATVLISRVGGVGGAIAQQLAVAGVGRLILAHAGPLQISDMNRQILMDDAGIGQPRTKLMARRLADLNPTIRIDTIDANLSPANADALVAEADVIAGAAPLFEERFAMSDACARAGKPFVHAAMYDFEFQVAAFHPPASGCLRCLCPHPPPWWRRQFPVFGAVAGLTGSLAAAEIIKLITGIGTPLTGRMIAGELRGSHVRTLDLPHDPSCLFCRDGGARV